MPARRSPKLSKTRYLSGLQCPLRLWFDCYQPDLAAELGYALEHRFRTGHEVDRVAVGRHPGGRQIDLDHLHHDDAVAETRAAMADHAVPAIFEAAFVHRDVRVRVDILARAPGDRWDLIEVKSSTRAKEVHLHDVALQRWVAESGGVRLRRVGVLVLNRNYIYDGGAYDLDRLFVFHDTTEDARAMASEVASRVEDMHVMLRKRRPPVVAPSNHCFAPYTCAYYEQCTDGLVIPEHPIGELPRLAATRRAAFEALGIAEVAAIPDEFALAELQARVRDCVRRGAQYVGDGLRRALDEPELPIHHLDFEAFAPALPRYPGTRPYQALPFQWSNHIERSDGTLGHDEFLCRDDVDPREAFARSLLETLGSKGTICIYSTYEVRVIRELADVLPSLRGSLAALTSRVWDLLAVIRTHYYHPGFRGSFSLKRVLPVLAPDLSYASLAVQDGEAAARAHLAAIATEDPAERARLQEALLTYCGLDTMALVRLRSELARRVDERAG